MAPGVNRIGRQTGTVPKTKAPINTGHDNSMSVSRTHSRSNIPNNLTTQDWQPVSGSGRNRQRKTSNTQASLVDYYEVPDSRITHENGRRYSSENQDPCSSVNKHIGDINGLEASTSTSSRKDCVRRTPRNIMPDKENKSNITKMPDRAQVTSRLEQIRDHIQQTTSVMEVLKLSGKPSHLAQYEKLAGLVEELQDSETKLVAILGALDRTAARLEEVDRSLETEENANGVSGQEAATSAESQMPNGSTGVNGVVENGIDSNQIQRENGAVLKTADGSRCNELRMRLEESQRKLQAMQEHQAALQALQQRTQEQLKEARAAQSSLMACTAAAAAADAVAAVEPEVERAPEVLHSNHESYDQLYTSRGSSYDHGELDKLQELQTKKERMDHLVAEFQSVSNGPSLAVCMPASRDKGSGESSADGSDEEGDGDGNMSDLESDVQRVRQKMAQLSAMRAQLKRLQNLVDSGLQDTEGVTLQDLAIGQQDDLLGQGDEAEVDADEEQAVNLRRQQKASKGRSVSRTNSTSSNTTKPDNIQASIGALQESEQAVERKTLKLKEAKSRLHQLQMLLGTVMDLKSRGEPVPEHYLRLLEEETCRVDQEQAVEQAEAQAKSVHLENVEREQGATALTPLVNGISGPLHPFQDGREVTLEMVQVMAQEIRSQTQALQEEKERLMRCRQEIGNLRDLPVREKKTNTQMLLQAKKRELEELMRKDQGQSSAVNQDICSEISAAKSETPGFSFMGEGTSAATWGGSTQCTLDDLGERDDDVQEQSGGYSSDEGQDEEEARQQFIGSQLKHTQLNTAGVSNNSNHNNASSNNKESAAVNRDALNMSLETGFGGGAGLHSNTGSAAGSYAPSQTHSGSQQQQQHHQQQQQQQQQRSGPRNVWRKSSTDSSATLPRAVWTPSQHPNTVEEAPANISNTTINSNVNHNENDNTASNISQTNHSQASPSLHNNWWQQQAAQLQNQLDATNRLCQSLLLDQQHQQSMPPWPQPQPPALTQMTGLRGPLPPMNPGPGDTFYQQLLAATQFQQQQLLLTTLNQCCHLLWMQQREMASLRGIVMGLQERFSHGSESYPSGVAFSQEPEDTLLISSQNSSQQTPHHSQSNLSRSHANSTPVHPGHPTHPPLKVSYSGGLFQLPEELAGLSGVTNAQSLPNLTQTSGSVFSDLAATSQSISFLNNSYSSRFTQPLMQYSLPQAAAHSHGATGMPWLQQPAGAAPAPGLMSAHASSGSPVPALNNQVPPGNRANNYWDNFRSYSRQNLLSTSTKSNEGVSHSPSPLVDRSHNTLRNPAGLGPQQPPPGQPPYAMSDQGFPHNLTRKEKLNIERYHHAGSDNFTMPSGSVPDMSEVPYHPHLANNQYHHNANMQVDQQQSPGPRVPQMSVSNNTSSGDARAPSSWHNRPGRFYRGSRGTNSKRKNPRLVLPVAATPASADAPPSSSSLASTPQDRNTRKHREALCHRSGSSLFDVLSESVYTEVAALIAVNEARPHFLIQLFRDLQMVSSDPLRQRTLQSIHELVSRYMAEASGSRDGSRTHKNVKTSKILKETVGNDSLESSDEEENAKMPAGPPSLGRPAPSVLSPPRNAAWSTNEEMTLPSMLPQGQNEWELEAVLEDLLPFLKSHLDEMCSPVLLDAVRQQAVQLMLAQTQAHCRHPPVPMAHAAQAAQHQPAGGFFQGQLDALLEDGLNKFQGCRLRDVCEDLLVVITDILQSELTFLKLVDTVRRDVDDSSEDACKNPPPAEEPANPMHSLLSDLESASQSFPAAEPICQNRLESLGSAEGYNGDLAEADQSHHEEAAGGVSPQHVENEVAGAVVPEDSDDDGLLEITQSDLPRTEEKQDGLGAVLNREDCEEQVKTEAEDEWAVEQDREQGLDRVPTRLTDETDALEVSAGPSANPPDSSSNP